MQSRLPFNPESGGSLLIDSFIANATGGKTQVRNANVNTEIRIRGGIRANYSRRMASRRLIRV